MGIPSSNIYIGDIGDVVEINENYLKKAGTVPAGRVLVDGLGVGDVGSIVLRDRKHLGEDGLIVVVCTLSEDDGRLVAGPDVVSRGFVYVRESEPLLEDAKVLVQQILENCSENGIHDWGTLKTRKMCIRDRANIERVDGLLQQKPSIVDAPEVVEKYGDMFTPKKENWEKLEGDIEFEDVSFKYPDGHEYVLEHFNLKVPKGSTCLLYTSRCV